MELTWRVSCDWHEKVSVGNDEPAERWFGESHELPATEQDIAAVCRRCRDAICARRPAAYGLTVHARELDIKRSETGARVATSDGWRSYQLEAEAA